VARARGDVAEDGSVKPRPLLCELHSHSTWSDGALRLPELVDLYGRNGFDVLAVTDHVLREDDPFAATGRRCVHAANFGAYLVELAEEAARAREEYDLLVLPGLELTFNAHSPNRSGHALAVGLREFVHVDAGLERALESARVHGATLIAAHPSAPENLDCRRTAVFAVEPRLRALVDRFELFNRNELFSWVADARLPGVATGDFHLPEHLATWKTLLPCPKDERAIVAYLRSRAPAFLAPLSVAEPVAA
jgi:predicted metal-dependent phosphoesterase TrpH